MAVLRARAAGFPGIIYIAPVGISFVAMLLPTIYDVGFLLFFSAALAAAVVYPIELAFTAVYFWLVDGNPKTPRILLMIFATLSGVFSVSVAMLLGYAVAFSQEITLNMAFIAAIGSVVAAFVVFPLVFLMSFYFSILQKGRPKANKELLRLWATYVGVLCGMALLYIYLKYGFLPEAYPLLRAYS